MKQLIFLCLSVVNATTLADDENEALEIGDQRVIVGQAEDSTEVLVTLPGNSQEEPSVSELEVPSLLNAPGI